jgi:hypothetical protein
MLLLMVMTMMMMITMMIMIPRTVLLQLRASYRAYDHMDEIAAACSVAFTPYGDKIIAGP